jgi:hypothetical protein
MHLRWVLLWSLALLLGVAVLMPAIGHVPVLARMARYEAAHIFAHILLYATLAFLARRAGLSPGAAAALSLGVGAVQESLQLVWLERGPGLPELFDLGVDAVAVLGGLAAATLLARRDDEVCSEPPR